MLEEFLSSVAVLFIVYGLCTLLFGGTPTRPLTPEELRMHNLPANAKVYIERR